MSKDKYIREKIAVKIGDMDMFLVPSGDYDFVLRSADWYEPPTEKQIEILTKWGKSIPETKVGASISIRDEVRHRNEVRNDMWM